jgi:hypothetical protein
MGMDEENALRFDPAGPGGHVESHFLKANSRDGRRAVWVKHTVFAPPGGAADAVAEVWAIAFDREHPGQFPVGGKVTVPFTEARVGTSPFEVVAGGAQLRSGHAVGAIESNGHRLRWDLRYDASAPPFRPFPSERMYRGSFPKTKTVTPCPDGQFSGEVEVDGERWAVDGWPGMQGHNWGRGHADAYVWAHCNTWDGPSESAGAWFEGFSGRVRLGPVMTPWLSLAALHVGGRTLRFDGPASMLARGIQVGVDHWRFRLRQGDAVLHGELMADKDAMAGLHYANPRGPLTYCLNSKLARGTLRLEEPGRPDLELTSDRIALEIGTHDPAHGVRMVA